MNVSEVYLRVKRQFGDESGVQVRDQDILRWINDAQHDIGQTQEILETIGLTVSVAGQGNYPLPADIINLRSVYYNNVQVSPLSLQEFEAYTKSQDVSQLDSGTPIVFYVYATEIQLFPVPVADGDTIKLYYSQYPADVSASSDPLSVPVKYHTRIVEYCLTQAYELDENFDAAALKGGQYSAGMTQLAEDSAWTEHSTYPMITVLPEDM